MESWLYHSVYGANRMLNINGIQALLSSRETYKVLEDIGSLARFASTEWRYYWMRCETKWRGIGGRNGGRGNWKYTRGSYARVEHVVIKDRSEQVNKLGRSYLRRIKDLFLATLFVVWQFKRVHLHVQYLTVAYGISFVRVKLRKLDLL